MTQPVPAPAAMPPLAVLAAALADLLERETALVRRMKIAEIAPLQAEKTRLTQLLRMSLKPREGEPATAALAGRAKAEWLVAGTRLAQAAMENERALRIGRAATERLVAAIAAAVRQSRRPPTAYGAGRAAAPALSVAGIAVDHRL
jgi:hypothetical protein